MAEEVHRKILIYSNNFEDFYSKQTKEVQKNIDETVGLVQELKVIPENIFKRLENSKDLYEILVKTGIKVIRIFCFLDGNEIIILQIGFRSRLKKDRDDEIEKANKLRKEYYFEKKKGKRTNAFR